MLTKSPVRRPDRCNSWCMPDRKGVCKFCGWIKRTADMPLELYDITIDQRREVTQEDIDRLCLIEQAYGKIRHELKGIHNDLLEDLTRATQVVG